MIFNYSIVTKSENLLIIKSFNKALDTPYSDNFEVEEIHAVFSHPSYSGCIYIRYYKIEFLYFNLFQSMITSMTVEAIQKAAELWLDKVGKKGLLTNKFKSLISRKSVMVRSKVFTNEEQGSIRKDFIKSHVHEQAISESYKQCFSEIRTS